MLPFLDYRRRRAVSDGLAQGPCLSLLLQREELGAGVDTPASPLRKLRLQRGV